MNQFTRAFPDFSSRMGRLTTSTRTRLARSLVRALRGRPHDASAPLSDAVGDGCRELRTHGMADSAILDFFGALVEDAGRACGADRLSLISGQPRWTPVRVRVLELATDALQR
jgi:hypothetical protein